MKDMTKVIMRQIVLTDEKLSQFHVLAAVTKHLIDKI